MRHYDIAYVPNPGSPSIPMSNDINELDLRTIVKYYLCGKSHGKISECRRCPAPCAYGKRALDLAFPKPNTTEPPKLIDNKTMLELAKEELARRKQEEQKNEKPVADPPAEEPRKRAKRMVMEGWYEKAYASDNPLQWIMDTFGLNERKAKQKVYSYQHHHPECREKPMWKSREKQRQEKEEAAQAAEPAKAPEEEVSVEETPVENVPAKNTGSEALLAPLEEKINTLMNKQEEYKSKYEYYLKLYNDVKGKVDALYEALSILNE